MARVEIYDTTLRDGTQGQGFTLTSADKIAIAGRLDAFGIDLIEGGWPGSNPKDADFFARMRDVPLGRARLAAFGSTRHRERTAEDDPNLAALLDAGTPVVTVFGKSWPLHVTEALGATLEQNLAMIRDSVAYLVAQGREVIYDAEHFYDGWHADPEYAMATLAAATEGGASRLVLCDTNGGTLPTGITEICGDVKARFPDTPLGIHTHNDSELGVANAIAAVNAGAVQVQGTINGYGERTGNCNLTSVIPILQLKMGVEVVPALEGLQSLSFFVDDLSNNPHFSRAPFVGRTAFAHKGGMHVNAVQKLAASYEHIEPGKVGNQQQILVSELSGQSNILIKAEQSGVPLEKGSPDAKAVLARVKELENEGYSFEAAGGSLELLIMRQTGCYAKPFELKEFHTSFRQYRDGHDPVCEATVKIYVGDLGEYTVAEGHGVVNALDRALRKGLRQFYPEIDQVSLLDYKVRIVSSQDATAAKTRVLIVSGDGESTWGTVGVSENIIEASWIAIVDAIDLFLQRRRLAGQALETTTARAS